MNELVKAKYRSVILESHTTSVKRITVKLIIATSCFYANKAKQEDSGLRNPALAQELDCPGRLG